MGKGGGCIPSKKKDTSSAEDSSRHRGFTTITNIADNAPIDADEGTHGTATVTVNSTTPPSVTATLKVFIIYYSMYGHVEILAKRIKKGFDGVKGVEGVLYRIPETLPADVVEHMKAPSKTPEVSEIQVAELAEADGFLFGFPTRYGCMAAQMKAFFDSTGHLWKEQTLTGKPAGFFVSSGTQGGGQETTAWTAITQLVHHGMLFVPIGYTFGAGMFRMDSLRGGSPYGAGVYAGDGSREPTESELGLAEHQGKYMAAMVKRLC
ncbi:putative NAD(P)H dehydrogenase (quinone) FQR1-like 2 [Hibiscus syriacus]|uniref:NAD(P)H dehydrogenase (quinone) n=1 Tax=Hibiscus syriacus TaxID=106335 RepID=A0A6A2WMX5_HIBSY|nr:probable NAD(P)H dehydrogenase (quinone) FQR1-like 2 [Hibiscus syriacus]KAE8655110.1 putative NAD(P)H dehydrogenase (quinone) FQR1-like 2 [Hibiscus syriacus]